MSVATAGKMISREVAIKKADMEAASAYKNASEICKTLVKRVQERDQMLDAAISEVEYLKSELECVKTGGDEKMPNEWMSEFNNYLTATALNDDLKNRFQNIRR